MVKNFLAATASELGTYGEGIRRKFGTFDEVLSFQCASVKTDITQDPLDTNDIERQNSEVTQQAATFRAPGRNLLHAARENLLHQTCVVPLPFANAWCHSPSPCFIRRYLQCDVADRVAGYVGIGWLHGDSSVQRERMRWVALQLPTHCRMTSKPMAKAHM